MPLTLEDIHLRICMPDPDHEVAAAVRAREAQLTKPPGSLGRLEDLAVWLAMWQGRCPPRADRVRARVFAGNHGIAAHGVSAYPAEVTVQMVANFEHGGAAINQLCRAFGVELDVYPIDLARPTAAITERPAMTEDDFLAAFNVGYAAELEATDLLCLGEMGIGNTTAAAALCLALFGGKAEDWTGPGTGVGGAALDHKTSVVAAAVAAHRDAKDPLDWLRRLGGREFVAIAGAIVAARWARVPVVLDGFVCTAAAAALEACRPGALDHCLVGHVSAEPGHRRLLARLEKRPLLDFDMRLGEASGAVLASAIVRAAATCHAGMATFAEAGVTSG